LRSRRRPDWLLLVGLIALGFLLARIQTNARNVGRTDPLSAVARFLVSPVSNGLTAAANATSDLSGAFIHGRSLQAENRRLREQAALAANYSGEIERLQQEIDEVRNLSGWQGVSGRQKVPADVIGFFPHESRITLNVGSNKGIKRGMPVVTYEGLVGRIETVDATVSQALLITAPSTEGRISALVERQAPNPSPAGLIRGEGPNAITLELADPTATVESGDTVITAGFSPEIPRGIVIGRVVSVQDDPAFGKRTATVFPRVSLGQIREVVVLR
jgi:rod shape-determining protein MreC